MNHRDFTRVVQKALGGTATESAATLAIEAVTRALTDGLAEDAEVRLAGFGHFRLRLYANRPLPCAGESEDQCDWMRLSFTPSRNTVLPARAEDKELVPPCTAPETPPQSPACCAS